MSWRVGDATRSVIAEGSAHVGRTRRWHRSDSTLCIIGSIMCDIGGNGDPNHNCSCDLQLRPTAQFELFKHSTSLPPGCKRAMHADVGLQEDGLGANGGDASVRAKEEFRTGWENEDSLAMRWRPSWGSHGKILGESLSQA